MPESKDVAGVEAPPGDGKTEEVVQRQKHLFRR
jgi:hypothetical protein